jgi:hypothetical protein
MLTAMLTGITSHADVHSTTLEVGYMPILPVAQLFVMEGEGWTEEAGLDLELTRFSSGPAMVQALASGFPTRTALRHRPGRADPGTDGLVVIPRVRACLRARERLPGPTGQPTPEP